MSNIIKIACISLLLPACFDNLKPICVVDSDCPGSGQCSANACFCFDSSGHREPCSSGTFIKMGGTVSNGLRCHDNWSKWDFENPDCYVLFCTPVSGRPLNDGLDDKLGHSHSTCVFESIKGCYDNPSAVCPGNPPHTNGC